MERISAIYEHPLYKRELERIRACEKDRAFCGHDVRHFLDVARIGRILCLERGLGISKELMYAAALLHDIGRARQYEEGLAHDRAGAEIAADILPDCGFEKEEIDAICQAIADHRLSKDTKAEKTELGRILFEADHLSRDCYACPVEGDCYWPAEKKNLKIRM